MRGAVTRALLGTVLGSVPGFLLPFAITTKFHVGPLTDAYAFALGVAMFASSLFVGVLQTNVLPILQRLKRVSREAFVGRVWLIGRQATLAAILLYGALAAAAVFYSVPWVVRHTVPAVISIAARVIVRLNRLMVCESFEV